MKDYCLLTNFPYSVPIELEGTKLIEPTPNGYQLIPEVWAESFALERQRIDAKAKSELDSDWAAIDGAAAGNAVAMMQVRIWRLSGWKPPKDREIRPSTLGQKVVAFSDARLCKVCGVVMVIKDRRSHCCSPACKAELRKARAKRSNANREKVRRSEHCCLYCNTPFTPARIGSRFCSVKCRVANHRLNHRYDDVTLI